MDTATLRLAAWHRAHGDSWDLIGAKLQIPVSQLEIVPAIYLQDWQAAMAEYAPVVAQDTLFHAQAALRLQTMSLNEKVAQTASLAIMKHDSEEKKLIAKREALLAKALKAAEAEPTETPPEAPISDTLPEAPITETPAPESLTSTPPEATPPVVAEEPEIDLVGQVDWNSLPKPPKHKGPKTLTSFLGGK
ncbi:MAG: hypothetical protein ACRC8S_10565 [Fimbriiglobus sp.]